MRLRVSEMTAVVFVMLAVFAGGYLLAGPFQQELIYNAAGWAAALAIVVRLVTYPPQEKTGWVWLLAGTVSFATGDLLYFHHEELLGGPPPFPGPADYLYFAAYPLIAIGLGTLIKQRKGGFAAAIDGAMLATTAGLLMWVFVIDAAVHQASVALVPRILSLSYPLGGVLLISMAGWLAFAPGGRTGPFRWLIAACAFTSAADAVYARQLIDGTYVAGTWLDLGWVLTYVCIAAAALDPSPTVAATRVDTRMVGVRGRTAILAATGLLGPGIIALAAIRGMQVDTKEVVVGCLVLFLLALGRMALLATAVERQRAQLDERGVELSDAVARLTEAEADRNRLLEAMIDAAESERAGLARELHDGPIQHLATLTFETALALMALDEGDVPAARESIDSLQQGLAEEVDQLRTLMSNLRPPALDENGLAEALRDQVTSFAKRTGIDASYSAELPHRLEPAVETILYRAVQESLINIQKHAGANRVTVRVATDLMGTNLTITDNGAGFDTVDRRAVLRDGHLGLIAMKERVEMAGGQLVLQSQPKQGTTIRVLMPAPVKEVLGA